MTDRSPTPLLEGLAFPEGLRWHEGRLWLSDMHHHEVIATSITGERETVARVEHRPSGLGWLPDGTLVIVSMTDRRLLRLGPDGLVEHADLSGVAGFRCNDMIVDSAGRAYVGNFGFDLDEGESAKTTNLVMVEPNGTPREVATDLMFPNGTVITPDGKTLIVAETFALRLTAFDVQADGSLKNRRIWAQLAAPPDGICLDAEGCIWVAVPVSGGGFVRVAEGGDIKGRIDSGDHGAFACALGGEAGTTLFLAEAITGRPQDMAPGNGRVRAVEVDAPHAGLP